MNRRDLLKTALWSVPALFGGGFSLSCGSNAASSGPGPSPQCASGSHAKGLNFASATRLNGIAAAPAATQSGPVNLATSFSLDDVNLLTRMGYGPLLAPVGNQGQQGSCVAWGVGYAAASFFARLGAANQLPPTSPSAQASPADLYAKLLQVENSQCGNGTLVADALDIAVVYGIADLASSPYSDQLCSSPSTGSQFLLNGYTRLDPNNQTLLKQYIAGLSVIPLGITVFPDFEAATGSTVYSPSGGSCSLGGHCVALIGYDDGRQAFRIMNSWGTGWGDNGFLWVSYNGFSTIVQEAYLPTGSFWPKPMQGTGGIVSGSVTSTGSIGIAAAEVFSWNGPDPTSSTPYIAFANIALSGPLLVTSVQIQYVDSNPADTVVLGNYNIQQWSRTLIFQTPLSTTQDATVFGGLGRVTITVSGTSITGQPITTSCQVTPGVVT